MDSEWASYKKNDLQINIKIDLHVQLDYSLTTGKHAGLSSAS